MKDGKMRMGMNVGSTSRMEDEKRAEALGQRPRKEGDRSAFWERVESLEGLWGNGSENGRRGRTEARGITQ